MVVSTEQFSVSNNSANDSQLFSLETIQTIAMQRLYLGADNTWIGIDEYAWESHLNLTPAGAMFWRQVVSGNLCEIKGQIAKSLFKVTFLLAFYFLLRWRPCTLNCPDTTGGIVASSVKAHTVNMIYILLLAFILDTWIPLYFSCKTLVVWQGPQGYLVYRRLLFFLFLRGC